MALLRGQDGLWLGTLLPLEAVAPLVVGDGAVLVRVTGAEEGLRAPLVLVQVNAPKLRLVQEQVVVCIKSVKHPAE